MPSWQPQAWSLEACCRPSSVVTITLVLKVGDAVFVLRKGGVVPARIRRTFYARDSVGWFYWRADSGRGTGGGLGRCFVAEEGITWTRTEEKHVDAFRVAVALGVAS
jgi:hypothetical protein